MPQRRPFRQDRGKSPPRPPIQVNLEPFHLRPKPAAKVFGKPFTLLEDASKKTFEFQSGAWVEYALSIAECRAEGEVKELAQKVNNMTRYEVRLPK